MDVLVRKIDLLGGGDAKKREHSRERTWTAEAPSTNFAHFGVRDRAKIRL